MRFFKKIIILVSLFFSWTFFLWVNNVSYAETNVATNNSNKDGDKLSLYQTIWQSLYAITWPLIIISWKFMDNSVVYGSFIWMDTLLWKIWNIFRTFANYIIWLVLIFSIFTLFMWWKLEKFNPIKLLPKLVISAILVNASWFLIWACIDLSNILTYTVSTLPLKIAWKNDKLNDLQIPKFWISFQDSDKPIKVWIVDKAGKILPFCDMDTIKEWPNEWKLEILTQNWSCVYTYDSKYYTFNGTSKIINNLWDWVWTEIKWSNFNEVKNKLWEVSWILWTLYASTINIWKTVNFPAWSSVMMATDVIMKLIFLFALIIPLFTLAIILIIRTVILWMFIIVSPLVFLFTWLWDSFKNILWDKWKLWSLCCVVFLPVIVVFALSISFIFLNSITYKKLSWNFWINWTTSWVSLSITKDNSINIEVPKTLDTAVSSSFFANFSETLLWIIRNVFAIWFMWILTFTALKSCKITSKISSSIQNFSQSMVKAAPIVPFAWWQSITSLWQGIWQVKSIPKIKQQNQFDSWIWWYIKEIENRTSWVEKEAMKTFDKHISSAWNTVKTDVSSVLEKKDKSKKKYWEEKISSFIDSSWNLTTLWQSFASNLWIDWKTFTDLLKKEKNDNDLYTISSEIQKQLLKNKIKNYIQNDLLDKNVTLLQLDNNWKSKLISQLKEAWYNEVDITQNKELYCVLKSLWFEHNNIVKLMAKNLIWTIVEDKDKNVIDSFKNTSCS